ncbi:molybdate ABC transporter substrate-binding protein [Actinomadura craniellae]|uniref:Molybdate ABC transporter substrate-binding protein n=1 Tax=Actinomadura craniellae TaxID=2231787 RepID=A0A365GYU8_9ACTN|nr:molybdate ABC transporter substrate-binding protein [Actinomadura craniellae]RAY11992.1 molybdate ABC transporter substrate-binding protein [Actinomadura craniellae]
MRRFLACPMVCLLLLAGCGGPDGPRTITVFATSSLTEVFGELGAVYQRTRPGTRVRFVFAGSQELVRRLDDRRPVDVLATADADSMRAAGDHVPRSRVIARTGLTIAVAPGNPERIRGLADLAHPRLRVVLGAPSIPIGRYSRRALVTAGVTVRPASEEISARSVLTRVRTGEADAGIVYITDLRSAGAAADHVPIPADQNVTAAYRAGAVQDSAQQEAGAAFAGWLTSKTAQAVFRRHGFTVP